MNFPLWSKRSGKFLRKWEKGALLGEGERETQKIMAGGSRGIAGCNLSERGSKKTKGF